MHHHAGTGTRATITGLEPSSSYRVQVRAKNSIGEGDWSDLGLRQHIVVVVAAGVMRVGRQYRQMVCIAYVHLDRR